MKSNLKIYTSFVSPLTLPEYIQKELLPIFIIRNISNSKLIGGYSGTQVHYKILAPSTELFRLKRDTKITIPEFHKRYAIEISDVNLEKIIREWEMLVGCAGAKGIILLGYGSDDASCHRSTLRAILNNSGLLTNRIEEILL